MPRLYFTHRRHADLPLHYGRVPPWLAERMSLLGGAIVESVVLEYGTSAFLKKISDPFWFQALGCVLGMDWHSSGITTSVMGALKRAVNPKFKDIGIYFCGGKGKYSRQTPSELFALADKTGLDGNALVRSSRLSAKIDNNAIQDGFQIYLHSFIATRSGEWAVVQQGMNDASGMARRYHWNSADIKSYHEEPHTFIYGKNQGVILNLTHRQSADAKDAMLETIKAKPQEMLPEIQQLIMPSHHDVRAEDVDLKRLGAVLVLAHEKEVRDFESLLLLEGVGPRTVQSLALVSEIIHGAPSRFSDPARFSFAHGGKDGHPFPVPLHTYDETISMMQNAVEKAKLGITDKQQAIKNLSLVSQELEKNFHPDGDLEDLIEQERRDSYRYGGRTVFGKAQPPEGNQLKLFQ